MRWIYPQQYIVTFDPGVDLSAMGVMFQEASLDSDQNSFFFFKKIKTRIELDFGLCT
jgi:hypothetical protein